MTTIEADRLHGQWLNANRAYVIGELQAASAQHDDITALLIVAEFIGLLNDQQREGFIDHLYQLV